MKNFPDESEFHELVKRLQSYGDEPEELVWKNIDAALRPSRTMLWFPWIDGVTTVMAVLAFAFVYAGISSDDKINRSVAMEESRSITLPDKKNDFSSGQTGLKQDAVREVENEVNLSRPVVAKDNSKKRIKDRKQSNPSLHADDDFIDSTFHAGKTSVLNEAHGSDSLQTASPLNLKSDSSAQNSPEVHETKRLRKQKLTFYAHITPVLSFQRATPVSRDGVIVTELFNRSILSAERFAISLDAGVQGFISKRFEYYGGLSLYHQNQSLRYSYQSGDQVQLESAGDKSYTVTPKSSTGIVNYNMMNVGVNAGVLYHLYGNRLVHKIGAGISYQQGFGKGNSEVYKNAESSYLGYQIFYRNEISVSRRLRVFVQPTFTHAVRVRETLEAPFTLKPYNAGIGLGILYSF